jgi:hypothetical protein
MNANVGSGGGTYSGVEVPTHRHGRRHRHRHRQALAEAEAETETETEAVTHLVAVLHSRRHLLRPSLLLDHSVGKRQERFLSNVNGRTNRARRSTTTAAREEATRVGWCVHDEVRRCVARRVRARPSLLLRRDCDFCLGLRHLRQLLIHKILQNVRHLVHVVLRAVECAAVVPDQSQVCDCLLR